MSPDAKPVAVVTGAAGGIGQEIVVGLMADGYRVIAVSRRRPSGPARRATHIAADVTDPAEMDDVVARITGDFGRIDALVTAAAVLRSSPVHETSLEVWNEVIETNLTGVFLSCRAVLPAMLAARRGSIVNLSSVHAVATIPGTGAYAASKGAIISLSRQMAVEYADFGIRVNSLVIGAVDTAMSEQHWQLIQDDRIDVRPPQGHIGRMAAPAEIAKAVRFLASDDSSFVTGAAVTVDGGLLSRLM